MIIGPQFPALPAPGMDPRNPGPQRALPPPVSGVRPVRDDQRGRFRDVERQTTKTDEETDSAKASAARRRAPPEPEARANSPAAAPRPDGRDWTAALSAPFAAQVIAQEVMQSGLYIEPWRQAMNAYARAAATAPPPSHYRAAMP